MKITYAMADVGGSGYYRCVVPGRALTALGHEVRYGVTAERRDGTAEWRSILSGVAPDVLVVQRPSDERIVQAMADAGRHGAMLVVEVDDNLHETPAGSMFGTGTHATRCFETACKMASLIVTSTPRLAERYARFGRTVVIPNVVPWARKIAPALRERVQRIGWYGSAPSHRPDVAEIARPLTRWLRRHPEVTCVFFGDDMRGLLGHDVRAQLRYVPPVSFVDYARSDKRDVAAEQNVSDAVDTLLSLDLDLGLAPLRSTSFNGCKSDLKLREYAACGIPAIASRFGPYAGHAATANEFQWERALDDMLCVERRRSVLAAQAQRVDLDDLTLLAREYETWRNQALRTASSRAAAN